MDAGEAEEGRLVARIRAIKMGDWVSVRHVLHCRACVQRWCVELEGGSLSKHRQ